MAGDQRARRRHADEHRLVPVADRGGGLLAERRVRLVADDDRVGVGDVARVADEPLVGLDRHRAVGAVLAAHERRGDALAVAAVAQLAEELVDEVAAVREDQDPAGPRALDEAERRDGLAGAGRVLEPEALGGVGVLGRLGQLPLAGVLRRRLVLPVLRLLGLVLVLVVALLAGDPGRARARRRPPRRRRRSRCRSRTRRAARSSVPESASTWWAESSVPSASRGSSSLSRRSRPSSSDQRWRQPTDGTLAPSSSSASAASNARRRGVPAARATAASSSASTNGSRVNAAARAIASSSGMAGAAWTATGVDSAIRLGQIQVEGVATYVRCAAPRIRGPSPRPDRREGSRKAARIGHRECLPLKQNAERFPSTCHPMSREARHPVGPRRRRPDRRGRDRPRPGGREQDASRPAARSPRSTSRRPSRSSPARRSRSRSCMSSRRRSSRAACPRSSAGWPSSRAIRS